MRADANKIALRAVRAILDGARPFTLDVAGTQVACGVERGADATWPEDALRDLDATDAAAGWPRTVQVSCRWDGGHCDLEVGCDYWTSGRYDGLLVLAARIGRPQRKLLWVTVPTCIGQAEDGTSKPLWGAFSIAKRRNPEGSSSAPINTAMRGVLVDSGLPLLSKAKVALCDVELPSGALRQDVFPVPGGP